MICVDIDQLTPCLQDTVTGEMVETEVIRIRRKSFLQKFSKRNGWYTAWANLVPKDEVYALVIKGTVDIHMLHPYQILITSEAGHKIMEAYTYEWTDDEL